MRTVLGRRWGRWALATTVLALAATACRGAPATDGPTPADEPPVPREPVTLQVRNHHRTDVVIYLVRGNVRSRMGQVNAGGAANWTFPDVAARDAGGIHLVADPIGDRTSLRSERLVLQAGRRVVWTLESGLGRSSLAVY